MSTQEKKQSWRDLRNKIIGLVKDYNEIHSRFPTKISFTVEDRTTILDAPEADIGKELYPKILSAGVKAVPPPLGMEILTWEAMKTAVS